jgi:hypothetical protein
LTDDVAKEIYINLVSKLMPELVRRLVCWLITADNLLTTISPGKDAGFIGILACRLVLEFGIVIFDYVSVCTACGFVRWYEFGWIGDKGNVNIFWLSFFWPLCC